MYIRWAWEGISSGESREAEAESREGRWLDGHGRSDVACHLSGEDVCRRHCRVSGLRPEDDAVDAQLGAGCHRLGYHRTGHQADLLAVRVHRRQIHRCRAVLGLRHCRRT